MAEIAEWFTTKEAVGITGFDSVMMLHYLQREGIVRPSHLGKRGRGNSYRYRYGDLVVLKAVKRILDAGISTKKLKKAIRSFQKEYKNKSVKDAVTKSFAVLENKVIFFDNHHAVDLVAGGQLTFVFSGFDNMIAELEERAAKVTLAATRRRKTKIEIPAKERVQSTALHNDIKSSTAATTMPVPTAIISTSAATRT